MFVVKIMTSKMISIRDDIYKKLKKLKGPNESFSELIERLIANQQKNPLKHFGIAKIFRIMF
jgi:predicted CopG family antitoxin